MKTSNLFLIIPIWAFLLFFAPIPTTAQNNTGGLDLESAERTLQHYFDSLANAGDDAMRDEINKMIISQFRKVLVDPHSFEYPFDSITNAGILKSEDDRVRIYNWNVPYEAGYNVYHCFLQYKKNDSIRTFELNDRSEKIEDPETKTLDKDNWYGALYYRIIKNSGRFDEVYYTLLGYDPHDYLINRKVIEVLHFNKQGEPVFGAAIFKNKKQVSKRVLFEYSEFANMMLRYDKDKQMIVHDHLSPSEPQYEGQREFYGPDFSYDGFKFENGIWNAYLDLDLRLNDINFDD